jgi:hypothetical protein
MRFDPNSNSPSFASDEQVCFRAVVLMTKLQNYTVPSRWVREEVQLQLGLGGEGWGEGGIDPWLMWFWTGTGVSESADAAAAGPRCIEGEMNAKT